jgi:cation:H+ antiporter
MFLSILAVIAGIALLWQGAGFLIRGAQEIAKNLDVSPIVIAITIIALGTSIPELVVAILAALQGKADITLGNVIGSNIANIGLVLGISALFTSLAVEKHVVHKEFPFVLAAPVLLFVLGFDGTLSRTDGLLLILVAVVFHILLIKRVREGKFRRLVEDVAETVIHKEKVYWPHIFSLTIGLAGVILGAKLTVDSSVWIARSIGLSELVIGLSLVAIGTSLPELVTSAAAAKKKDGAISLGNIVGSNILNIFFVLGLTLIIYPIKIASSLLIFDIPVMLIFSLLLFLALLEYGKLRRREAIALLILYGIYIGYSFLK